jgi:hypothetical protein
MIPLPHLALDLDAPTGGWLAALRAKGVEVVAVDIDRPSISRADAAALFAERREPEQRRREFDERRFAELEEQRLARLRGGVPADQVPDGVHPAAAMLQAAKDAAPRRRTPLEEALDNDGSPTYHAIRRDQADES